MLVSAPQANFTRDTGKVEKDKRTDPVGGRLRLQLGQFCGIHGWRLLLCRSQKTRFAGCSEQILVNNAALDCLFGSSGMGTIMAGYFIRGVQPEDVVSCNDVEDIYNW